jgi:hypothetical protein
VKNNRNNEIARIQNTGEKLSANLPMTAASPVAFEPLKSLKIDQNRHETRENVRSESAKDAFDVSHNIRRTQNCMARKRGLLTLVSPACLVKPTLRRFRSEHRKAGAFQQCPERLEGRPVRTHTPVKVVASDHTLIEIPHNVRVAHNVRSHVQPDSPQMEELENGYSTMPEMQTSPSRSSLRLRRKS